MMASSLDLAPLEEGLRPGALGARARSLAGVLWLNRATAARSARRLLF